MIYCTNLIRPARKLIRRLIRKNRSRKVGVGWLMLPKDVDYFFLNHDSDVSKFLSSIQQVNTQNIKIQTKKEMG